MWISIILGAICAWQWLGLRKQKEKKLAWVSLGVSVLGLFLLSVALLTPNSSRVLEQLFQ